MPIIVNQKYIFKNGMHLYICIFIIYKYLKIKSNDVSDGEKRERGREKIEGKKTREQVEWKRKGE